MSQFSTSYDNPQNVLVTIEQATTHKELISLYLNNMQHILEPGEVNKRFYARLKEFEKKEITHFDL